MRESKVETYLHKRVERAGGTTRKFKAPGRKNVPDRIVIWQRSIYGVKWGGCAVSRYVDAAIHFVECKAPGKKANAGQAREHVRLQKLGCVVLVIDTIEKVDSYVERNK